MIQGGGTFTCLGIPKVCSHTKGVGLILNTDNDDILIPKQPKFLDQKASQKRFLVTK